MTEPHDGSKCSLSRRRRRRRRLRPIKMAVAVAVLWNSCGDAFGPKITTRPTKATATTSKTKTPVQVRKGSLSCLRAVPLLDEAWLGVLSSSTTMSSSASEVSSAVPVFTSLGGAYSYCLDHYYLPTQSATGGICASIGDATAQFRERLQELSDQDDEKNKAGIGYDSQRTLHYFIKGLGGGILWAGWFQVADPLAMGLTKSIWTEIGSFTSPLVAGSAILLEEADTVSSVTAVAAAVGGTNNDAAGQLALLEQGVRTAISILLEQFMVCPLMYTFWDIPLIALLSGSPWRQIPAQIRTKLGPLLVANAKVWTPVNLITYNIPVDLRVLFTSCADIVWQTLNAEITSQEIGPETLPGTMVTPSLATTEIANATSSTGTQATLVETLGNDL